MTYNCVKAQCGYCKFKTQTWSDFTKGLVLASCSTVNTIQIWDLWSFIDFSVHTVHTEHRPGDQFCVKFQEKRRYEEDHSPWFSSSLWKSARLRSCDCSSPSLHTMSRWSVEQVTRPFSLKLTNICTAPEWPIRSPVSSSDRRLGTSGTFLAGGQTCLLDRPKVPNIPKSPEEAGSAGKGRSCNSHILTLPSSEHVISCPSSCSRVCKTSESCAIFLYATTFFICTL